MKKNHGGTVYPREVNGIYWEGISRRDLLAGMAMQGILSCPETLVIDGKSVNTPKGYARFSYEIADAMIERGNDDG